MILGHLQQSFRLDGAQFVGKAVSFSSQSSDTETLVAQMKGFCIDLSEILTKATAGA